MARSLRPKANRKILTAKIILFATASWSFPKTPPSQLECGFDGQPLVDLAQCQSYAGAEVPLSNAPEVRWGFPFFLPVPRNHALFLLVGIVHQRDLFLLACARNEHAGCRQQ